MVTVVFLFVNKYLLNCIIILYILPFVSIVSSLSQCLCSQSNVSPVRYFCFNVAKIRIDVKIKRLSTVVITWLVGGHCTRSLLVHSLCPQPVCHLSMVKYASLVCIWLLSYFFQYLFISYDHKLCHLTIRFSKCNSDNNPQCENMRNLSMLSLSVSCVLFQDKMVVIVWNTRSGQK